MPTVILHPKPYEFDKKPTEIPMATLAQLLAKPLSDRDSFYRIEIDGELKTAKEWQIDGLPLDLTEIEGITQDQKSAQNFNDSETLSE